jgi:penicillin-binding protein 2
LNDSIAGPVRKAKVEQLAKLNLMPARIYQALRYRDSLIHAKDPNYLKEKGYIKIVKDTMGIEEEDDTEALDKLKKSTQEHAPLNSTEMPKSPDLKGRHVTDAVLPEKQKKPNVVDSSH